MDEMTYVDLLSKLHNDVKSDVCMLKQEKEAILKLIFQLEEKLWKYSA